MIKGFENETQELSVKEQNVIMPIVFEELQKSRGKERATTNRKLVRALAARGYRVFDSRIRKMVNYIRKHDMIMGLMASSNGYYIATSDEELGDYIESLNSREREIRSVRQSLIKQRFFLNKDNKLLHREPELFPTI